MTEATPEAELDGALRVDAAALPATAHRILDPNGPTPLRQMAAKGIAPGLKPHEALAVVVLLSEAVGPVADVARATLEKLPAPLVAGALTPSLDPAVVETIAVRYARDAGMMVKLLALPQLAPSTVITVSSLASEMVAELIATNEELLLRHPAIIEKLYMNRATRMSTADRILELAVRNRVELPGIPAYAEAAAAIMNELIPEPTEEPTFDDVLFREVEALAKEVADAEDDDGDTHELDEATGEEVVKAKYMTVQQKLALLTVSQRIRCAMLGTTTERGLLVRDRNRLVAVAAIKSPLTQENEVMRVASSRNVNDDVLRVIASNREWMGKHQIKLALVMNPRTPFVFVAKLIPHLRENELKALAKSKNVPGTVATAARQQLLRKK
jgi:hypothetical protein